MLWFAVMVVMVGIVAGAVGREVAAEPHALGDLGPWSFGVAGAAIGAVIGFLAAGANSDQDADQWAALLLCILGAAIGAGLFVALTGRHQKALQHAEGRAGPVSAARDSETGMSHGA